MRLIRGRASLAPAALMDRASQAGRYQRQYLGASRSSWHALALLRQEERRRRCGVRPLASLPGGIAPSGPLHLQRARRRARPSAPGVRGGLWDIAVNDGRGALGLNVSILLTPLFPLIGVRLFRERSLSVYRLAILAQASKPFVLTRPPDPVGNKGVSRLLAPDYARER